VIARAWPRAWEPLVAAAATALPHARSRPRRAAAILDADGGVHCGVSIQAIDPPGASLCAEQVAVASMCADGARAPIRLVVLSPRVPERPCGRCLQFLLEFSESVEIRWGTPEYQHGRSTVERLLPLAFRDYRGV
jgi:cytidine deaminase